MLYPASFRFWATRILAMLFAGMILALTYVLAMSPNPLLGPIAILFAITFVLLLLNGFRSQVVALRIGKSGTLTLRTLFGNERKISKISRITAAWERTGLAIVLDCPSGREAFNIDYFKNSTKLLKELEKSTGIRILWHADGKPYFRK